MLDEARLKRFSMPALLGVLSAVLYGTVALMPIFLVPLQLSGTRKGYRAMIVSAGASAIIIGIWQTIALAIGVSAPLAMILALIAMGSPRLKRLPFALRALLGAAFASAISLPSIYAAIRDPAVRAMFIAAFESAGTAFGAGSLDAETLWVALKTGIASSYGAVLFAFLFLSAWMGSRLGSFQRFVKEPSDGSSESERPRDEDVMSLPPRLSAYRLPGPLVWVLLASWAGLLVNRFFPSFVLSAVALNAALALSICYGVQGLAVAGALAERAGLAPALRILGPIALILLIVSGVAGLMAVGALALLGTLETWIPFRAVTKGDLP